MYDKKYEKVVNMKLEVYVKGVNEPYQFEGDKIDVLDFQLDGDEFKQIRYYDFNRGSESQFIKSELISKIIHKN